jgi:hypothetical protein
MDGCLEPSISAYQPLAFMAENVNVSSQSMPLRKQFAKRITLPDNARCAGFSAGAKVCVGGSAQTARWLDRCVHSSTTNPHSH